MPDTGQRALGPVCSHDTEPQCAIEGGTETRAVLLYHGQLAVALH